MITQAILSSDIQMNCYQIFVGCFVFTEQYIYLFRLWGPSWPWSYGSWIYNYICNQCLLPLMLCVRISIKARCTTLCDKVCQLFATDLCFFPGLPGSFNNKTDRHDNSEILLKVALNTIKQRNKHILY